MRAKFGIFLLIALCLQVKSELFPQGKVWKYSYYGLVRTGSLLPSEVYSQWDLRALLTITATDGIVLAQLSDFNSSLYNGPRDSIPDDLHPTPIPEGAYALGDPFIINYAGINVESISVKDNDPLWSVNIKRAIASVLQLNLDKLNTPASIITENNLYGSCSGIEYSVVNNTEFIYVRKVIDHLKCYNYPAHIWSSAPFFKCSGAEEDPFTASTTREYTLTRGEDKYELQHVMSNRRLYVQPFQAQGEAHQSYQYQVYQLLGSSPAPEKIDLPVNLINTSLTYVQNMSDLSHSRQKVKQAGVLNANNYLLDEVVKNLAEENLNQDVIQIHRELLFLNYNMLRMNKESFQTLYADISIGTSYQQETKRNIFLELLPQVGSEVSVKFVKDLIVTREIKDMLTIKMLAMFPFYLKQHSSKLLSEMEVLLTLSDNYEPKVRHAAVLSFATLVYQTYQAGKCDLETLEDYALKYFNSFAESTSYETRMLYLQGLDNLQLGSVAKYLSSIVQNNEQSRHIRFLAALASMQSAPERPIQTYQTYWPILTDRNQHLEMRVAAFTMLLISHPTKSRLLTLFWYMQANTDPHLYNYFYTTLISLQKTHYPCYKHLSKLASDVVRVLRPPRNKQQWMTGNYILDYSDAERAFGGIIQMFLIGNPVTNNPNVVYLTLNNFATEKNLNQMAVYLKLQGVADNVLQNINSQEFDLKNFDKLIKLLEEANVKLISPEEIHIELIVKIQTKTVFSYFVDSKGFKKFGSEMKDIKKILEYHVNYQSIVVPYTREYMEPSDVGTLVIRAIVSNSIASTRGNFLTSTEEQKFNYNFDVDFRYYTYTTSFLEIYNPISDMWNGVERGKKYQARFLFNGTLNIDLANSIIELTEVRNHNEYINVLIHSQSYTYLVSNGTRGPLQHHCPDCDNIYNITAGPKKDKIYLINKSFENFGNKFQVILFDCDSYQEVKNTFLDVYAAHQSNAQVLPIAKPLLYAMHLSDFITYIPCHGSCGLSINIKPLYKESTLLKTTLRLPKETQITSKDALENASKLTTVLTLTQQKLTDNTTLQFWNASLVSFWKPVKRYLNFTLAVDHEDSTKEENKLCMSSEIQFADIQADMFSQKPSKPTTANFNAIWGKNEKDDSCPNDGATIQAIGSASVTDEQKQIILSAENWPYKECKNSSLGHKYTPISLACYLASKEASTYRKYTSDIKFSNMPEWFISTAQKLQYLVGLIQKNPSENDKLEKTGVTNLKVGLQFSALEPEVAVRWNAKEAVVNYDGFEFFEKFLLNTRFLIKDDWRINLGLNKVCLITPKHLTTVDNRTIPIEDLKLRWKNSLVTADCSKHPKFAIFVDDLVHFDKLSYNVFAGNDVLRVKAENNNFTITLNEKEIDENDVHSNINVWRLEDDVILIKTKYNNVGVEIYYTKEYMVITIPGFYTGKICGLCSSIKTNIS